MSEYGRIIQIILVFFCIITYLGTKFGGVILTSQDLGIVVMVFFTNVAALMRSK